MQEIVPPLFFGLYILICLPVSVLLWLLPSYVPYDGRRIGELALCILSMSCLFALPSLRRQVLRLVAGLSNSTHYLLIALFLLGIFSSLMAKHFLYASYELNLTLSLVIVTFVFAAAYQLLDQKGNIIFIGLISMSCVAVLIQEVIIWVQLLHTMPAQLGSGGGQYLGFVNPRFFQQFQIWTFPFLLVILLFVKNKNILMWLTSLLVVSVWVLLGINASSKAFIISLLVGSIVCCCVHRKLGVRLVKYFLLTTVLAFVIKKISWIVIDKVFTDTTALSQFSVPWQPWYGSFNSRLQAWKLTLLYFKKHPWFGIGPMQYAAQRITNAAHPHNFLLQFLSEWGGLATVVLISLLLTACSSWLQYCKRNTHNNEAGYTCVATTMSLVSGLTYALFSGVLVMPVSQIFAMLVAAWAIGQVRQDKSSSPTLNLSMFIMLVTGFTIVSLIFCLWQQLDGLPQREIRWLLMHDGIFIPRFWIQGLL